MGNGIIYAITHDHDLLWYKHNGYNTGTWDWSHDVGQKVGNGWDFKEVIAGGDGVIYAITDDHDLLWYKHNGYNTGTWDWSADVGQKVGNGWDFKQVIAG
jgi:hypothetical protein